MTDTRSSVRQRKANAAEEKPAVEEVVEEIEDESRDWSPIQKPPTKVRVMDEDGYTPWLDILRVLTFLVFASCGLSYVISGGESFTWGIKNPPKYMKVDWWKAQLKGPIHLTLEELAQHDGTDPEKPLFLAINGSIYDVSANRRTYGPGGSYHVFAGVDASRGFVTGCFHEDRNADMRGVEDMFLPIDDPEVDKHFSPEELEKLKKVELEEALQKVHDQFDHWAKFFDKSPKYQKVGHVKREKNWLEKEPRKPLCEIAQKGRPKRKIPT